MRILEKARTKYKCYHTIMQTVSKLYTALNPMQKRAVDTIEGPVLCIAGPGTGKTQVVALRVAAILEQAHVNPRNILCLTFSNSGATAMRERLRSMIGPAGYTVTINTLHGFCNDIITTHPHVFEEWSSLEQISDIEQIRSLNTIIDQLMPDLVIVNKKSPYQRTKEILARISEVKREGKTLEDLRRVSSLFDVEMEGKSKLGTKAHEKNMLAARKFREFIQIFSRYQEMLRETERYDYDDMILHVNDALAKEDWLLAELQERYLYLLVDEFQDTNGAQYRLIELLTKPRTPEDKPNLFVVGDDDQAIYRFQGANLANILSLHRRFPDCPVIVLTTSYRCSQPILDAAGKLISVNTERLVGTIPGLTKDLVSGAERTDAPLPTLLRTPSDVTEPWVIADVVEQELRQGTAPSEIAILTQTNGELRPIYDVLTARSIPVQMDGKIDLLAHPLVLQVIAILRGIDRPEDTHRLAAAFGSACFGCHPADLGRLYQATRDLELSMLQILLSLEDSASPARQLPWINLPCIQGTRDTLLSLHEQLPTRTLVDTLEHLLRDCRLLPASGDASSFDPLAFSALQAFFEYVKFRSYEVPHYAFRDLLSDLDLYGNTEYGLRLSFSVPHLTEEGVKLLTAHQSKGLEYEVVILANFRDGHWDRRHNPGSLSLPEDLLFGWESEQKTFEQHQDERRVAYVAMTRAKRRLIFTCARTLTTGSKPKEISPSAFFVEAGTLPEEDAVLMDPTRTSTLLLPKPLVFDDAYQAFLHSRLKDFRLSVTALNHFLEDPLLFLERDLLQTPQSKQAPLVYGNAVHAALKRWGMSVADGLPLGLEAFLNEFRNYLAEREILTDKERQALILTGEEALVRYYEQRLKVSLPVVYKVEFPVGTYVDDIPLKGKIDRLDALHPDAPEVTVIDFKTGRPKTERQIVEDGYFRQLVFYSLLLEYGMPFLKPTGFLLDFVGEGSEHPVLRSFQVTEDDKRELKSVIAAVWKKIQALDFTPL